MGPPTRVESTVNAQAPEEPGGFWAELGKRRVPYLVGAYVAATAGVVQFVDWLVGRYALSTTLTDFVLVALVLLIPTAVMLAWRHGPLGRNPWTRVERLGVPINLVVAAGVLLVAFGGRSLGATTTTVTVEDEDGNEVQRVVPKPEFRRHITIFYFDNETGDPDVDWLQYGIPRGLWADWRQDFFMNVREGLALAEALREANHAQGLDVPRTLKREIAEDQKTQYFLTGEIRDGDDGFEVVTALYEVDGGRLVEERAYRGRPFDLIDQISAEVREDLGIPTRRLAETTDLSLDELLTESESAFREYVAAFRALAVDLDYASASTHIALAVEEDSTFALAHWLKYAVATRTGESTAALEALTAAKEYEYRLPERERLYVTREYHYTVRKDPAKGVAMAERSVAMFPDDLEALAVLGLYYQVGGRFEDAIGVYEQMLAVDPTQTEPLLVIGQLLSRRGRYEEALGYLTRYAEFSPDDTQTYPLLAAAYRGTGEFELAREACDRALLLEPEDVPAQLCLASIASLQGQWSEADSYFEDALASTRTGAARVQVHRTRENYLLRRGQIGAALNERGLELAAMSEAGASPIEILGRRMRTLAPFVWAGRPEAALDSAEAIGAEFTPPFENMPAIGEMDLFAALEDADALEAAADRVEEVIATLGVEAIRPDVTLARGQVLEFRGDCDAALTEYRAAIELQPSATGWFRHVGRCLATLGRLDEAVTALETALERSPYGPLTLTELARVEIERGNAREATAHLERALSVWSEADPGYAPAAEARALLASPQEN